MSVNEAKLLNLSSDLIIHKLLGIDISNDDFLKDSTHPKVNPVSPTVNVAPYLYQVPPRLNLRSTINN